MLQLESQEGEYRLRRDPVQGRIMVSHQLSSPLPRAETPIFQDLFSGSVWQTKNILASICPSFRSFRPPQTLPLTALELKNLRRLAWQLVSHLSRQLLSIPPC